MIKQYFKKIIVLSGVVFFLFVCGSQARTTDEELLIFLQGKENPVEKYFSDKLLPGIIKAATDMDINHHVVVGADSLPREVGITPILVYQNYRGRSVYQGRTTSLDRIKNFLRTSRRVPQGDTGFPLKNMPVWELGRPFVWSPLKIASLGGHPPKEYDDKTFKDNSIASIKKGFTKFHIEKQIVAGRSDRGFYMDFYPWLSADKTLYLSLALFSQFHCKKPIFTHKLTGRWEDRNRLFQQAAKMMETQVKKHKEDPAGGDGFVSVPENKPVITWKKLGYPLPAPPEKEEIQNAGELHMPKSWSLINQPANDVPIIQFRFPPPLDMYTGEVKNPKGLLSFGESLKLSDMKGSVKIDPRNVTMGQSDLNAAIQESLFLDTDSYPEASFVISNVGAEDAQLNFGRLQIVSLNGIFQLKGTEKELSIPAEVEPIIGKNGQPQLLISGSFTIDLRNFDIEGATGPEPQKYTLFFDFNLRYSSKDN